MFAHYAVVSNLPSFHLSSAHTCTSYIIMWVRGDGHNLHMLSSFLFIPRSIPVLRPGYHCFPCHKLQSFTKCNKIIKFNVTYIYCDTCHK
jgi:hypothetical protein